MNSTITRAHRLGDLIEFRNDIVHPSDNPTGISVFVGLEHIERDTGVRTGSERVNLQEMTGRRARFCAGDIVYGYLRPYLNKVWIAEFDGICSVDQYVFKVRAGVDRNYVAHFLRSVQFLETAPIKSAPGQLPRIRSGEISATPILLPSLDEQRRIAAILDKADAVRRKRSRAVALLDELVQSFFIEMFGDPVRNSHKLPLVPLGELGERRSGGTPPRGERKYFIGSIPWFSSGELNTTYVSESNEQISEEALEETSAPEVFPGSLMLGMYDTAALKSSIAVARCSCNQAIAFARIDRAVAETLYVFHAIQVGRDQFRAQQRGVRQKNLNLSLIREIKIPLPEISKQKEFVAYCLKLEHIANAQLDSKMASDDLFSALLSKVFLGRR